MKTKTNTITINGRTYDAVTGKPLHGQTVFAPQSTNDTPRKSTPHQKVSTITKPQTVRRETQAPKKISVTHVGSSEQVATRRSVAVAARPLDKSHTLMRQAVKKPGTARTIRTAVASPLAASPKIIIHKGKVSAKTPHVTTYSKSSQISRFGQRSAITKKTANIPVQPAPAHIHHKASTTQTARTSRYDIANTPPAVTHHATSQQKTLRETHRDLFESAMTTATSHQKPAVHLKRKHRRAARLALSAASLALLIGFFAYQNAPNIALKRASSTVGFTASVPGYRPSGFHMANTVQYSPGKVTIDFRSNSDSRSYRITQVSADMTDNTLRSKLLKGQPYEQVNTSGQTAYLYGADNLTWVRNGIWYTIDGDSELSKDQLLRVASSLF